MCALFSTCISSDVGEKSTCFEIGQDVTELQHNIDFHMCIGHSLRVVSSLYLPSSAYGSGDVGDFTMVARS